MLTEQQEVLDFMHAMKEAFGEYEFRVTLPNGWKLRSKKFVFKQPAAEIIPHVHIPMEKKNGRK